MQTLAHLLESGRHSLVVESRGRVSTYDGRGVSDLWRLLHAPGRPLSGSRVADRAVGRGAAAIMAAGGVRAVWTPLISRPALTLLSGRGIAVDYGRLVPHILNRRGDGICPVEQLCAASPTAEDCLPLIGRFLASMHRK